MITFGPVSSRRLGKSLGINNIFSPKRCSYNCLYCQLSETTRMCAEPENYYEPEVIFNEVKSHLSRLNCSDLPGYLIFVANGEPTLDINLGKTIRLLKQFGIPIAIISNGSVFFDKLVRKDVQLANWVSVKYERVYTGLYRKWEGKNNGSLWIGIAIRRSR